MTRTIKLLLAAVAMLTVLCTGAWAAISVPDDLRRGDDIISVWDTGEYVLTSNYTGPNGMGITIKGHVTLRLTDGCKLILNGSLIVEKGASLTIEGGQDPATAGRLEVSAPGDHYPAIGGADYFGRITINGGVVKAYSNGEKTPGIGTATPAGSGTVTINGGVVEARSKAGLGMIYWGDLRTDPGNSGWLHVSSLNNVYTDSFNGVIFDESDRDVQMVFRFSENGIQYFDMYAYFYGRVYGSPTIKGNVEFPSEVQDMRKSDQYDNTTYTAQWVLDIPEGQTLTIAPGATLKLKEGESLSYPYATYSADKRSDKIDNRGTLEINGVLRSEFSGHLGNQLTHTENVTGSGIVQQTNRVWGDTYLANNFAFYNRWGFYVYSTTFVIGSDHTQGQKCTAWADPPYALPGTRVRLIASPVPGYELDYWRGTDPSGNGDPTDLPISNDEFTMPAENVYIYAFFKKKDYAVNVFSAGGGGTASVNKKERQISAPGEIYDYVVDVTLTPRADPGYEFDGWAVLKPEGLVITDGKFTMPTSDVEIVAKFRKITHNITVRDAQHAAGMADAENAASGDVVTLRGLPDNGYTLTGWQAVAPRTLSIGEDGRFTMPNEDVIVMPTVSALPPDERSITVQNDGHGSATVAGGKASAAPGAQITLTPSPDPGYEFDRWVAPDGLGISGNGFTMPNSNVVVMATFRKKVYDIKVDPGVHGSAKQSRPSATSDDVVTLMPEPDYGYMFASWDITEPKGLVITDGNQFKMPNSPVRVKPIFATLPLGEHAIVVGGDGNGTGTPDPASAKSGDVVRLAPAANDGYVFDGWNVLKPASDLVISDDGTFEMPDSDVFVNAIFRKIPAAPTDHAITLHNVDGGGKATAAPNRAAAGTEITLTPYAKEGYDLDRWVVLDPAGLVISGNKFKMPDSDVSIVAVFKERETEQGSPQTPGQEQGTLDGAVNADKTDGIWSADADQDLTIYIEYDFDQFTKIVSLDGAPLKMDTANVSRDFGAREGSTVVTIWERTLKERIRTNGVHRAELGFKDGTVSVPFAAIVTRSDSHGGSSSGGSGGGCATGAAVVAVAAMAMIKRRTR